MENFEQTEQQETAKRPLFLTILCILTFISTVLAMISSLVMPFVGEKIVELMQAAPDYDEEKAKQGIKVLTAGWDYYGTTFLLALASFSGAFLMWKQKKNGFYVYAVTNFVLVFVPMLILSVSLDWFSVLLTSLFIGLYALNFKHLS
jgi:hypothetical protein